MCSVPPSSAHPKPTVNTIKGSNTATSTTTNPRVFLYYRLLVWAPNLDPNTYQLHNTIFKMGTMESKAPITRAHRKTLGTKLTSTAGNYDDNDNVLLLLLLLPLPLLLLLRLLLLLLLLPPLLLEEEEEEEGEGKQTSFRSFSHYDLLS